MGSKEFIGDPCNVRDIRISLLVWLCRSIIHPQAESNKHEEWSNLDFAFHPSPFKKHCKQFICGYNSFFVEMSR